MLLEIDPHRFHVHTDGGSRGNPGPAASAFIIEEHGAEPRKITWRTHHAEPLTNNEAEYLAMIAALEKMIELEPTAPVAIFTDSSLIVGQVSGPWKVKQESLRPFVEKARALYDYLGTMVAVTMQHIRREFNTEADALCNLAMDEAGAKFKRMERQS